MEIKNIFLISITVLYIGWGVFVYWKNKKSPVNIAYGVLCLGIAGWALTNAAFQGVTTSHDAIFWARWSDISAIVLASSLFYFSLVFPKKISVIRKFSVFILVISTFTLVLILVIFPDFVRSKVIIEHDFQKQIVVNEGFYLFTFYLLGFFIWTLINLITKYKVSTGAIKAQLKYVLTGLFVSMVLGVFSNLILPLFNNYTLVWVGPNFAIVLLIFVGYAIVRHRLMDIKFILRTSSVYSVSFLSIIFPIIIIKYIINKYAVLNLVYVDYLLIALAVVAFPRIKNYFFHLANKYFFSSLYNTRELISDLSDKLSSTLFVKKIYKYFTDTIISAFHCKEICFVIFNEKKQKYFVKYKIGFFKISQNSININKDFHDSFIKNNKAIIIQELTGGLDEKYKETIDEFTRIGAEIIIPLNIKNSIIGVVILGAKESKEVYNSEDIEVLEIIGAQSAIAIANALHYEEIKNFSKKMEREVKKATLDLKQANIKLKQLDEAKSEFVSIASHQLRTPLTIIKGYISMMLEGNFGRLTNIAKDSLEKVFESNERLIHLVENLLNISRIESGRLKFNYEDTQLEKLVGNVIDELDGAAEKKNIKLTFVRPAKSLPKIKIDQEKIRQVVMNLIDNAIKYSAKGEIKISLKPKYKNIMFCVKDRGMGIKKDDLLDLFDKFTRGSGTDLVHTEGTGLGLYVARQMILAHKGEIWAESGGAGKGSMFCFKLPVE